MNNTIIEVLNYLGEKFNIAIDWTSENVVPYIQELFNKFIQWEISTSIAWIIISVAVTATLWIGFIISSYISRHTPGRCTADDVADILCIISCIVSVIAIIVVCFQTFDIIECKTFPEKALFDYIKMNTDILD